MRNKLVVGAGVKCYLNGVDLGIVIGINWSVTTQREEEHGLDTLHPFEASPMATSTNGTIQVYRVRDDDGLEGYHLVRAMENIELDQYFTIELKDRVSGVTYLKVNHASITAQSWSVGAKGVLTGQFSFVGLSSKHGNQG